MRWMSTLQLAFVLMLLASVGIAHGEIAAATNPKSVTQRDVVRLRAEHNRRAMTDAYKQVGVRDPRWDALAETFLDAMAVSSASLGERSWAAVPGALTMQQVYEAGRAAYDAGCRDPLVLHNLGFALDRLQRWQDARAYYDQSYESMLASQYGPYWKCMAAQAGMSGPSTEDPEIRKRWARARELRDEYLLEFTDRDQYSDADRRIQLEQAERIVMGRMLKDRPKILAALRARGKAHPAVLATLAGRYHIDAAWEARGGGWAADVTEEGWRGFAEQLAKARVELTRAWQADPSLPHAATSMIRVAMAGHAARGEDERLWFDRATSAQFDCEEAYDALMWALRPRWGGSAEAMLDFGRECLATGRFDTIVPHFLVEAVLDIANDRDNEWSFIERPEIFVDINAALEGYAAALPEDAPERHEFASRHFALAWRAGQHALARRILDDWKGPPRLLPQHFTDLGTSPAYAVDQVKLLTGEHGVEAMSIFKMEQRGRTEEALAHWRRLREKLPPGAPGRWIADARLAEVDQAAALARGETVRIPNDLSAFDRESGDWTVDAEGWLVGREAGREPPVLVLWPALGKRYEFSGRFESLTPRESIGEAVNVFVAYVPEGPWCAWELDARSGRANMSYPTWSANGSKGHGKSGTFRVQMWDGVCNVFIDDKLAVRDHKLLPMMQGHEWKAGVGGRPFGNQVVRFRDLTLRLLTEPPKP
jgi:tetratricopeptide (TPR) repeat protein